MCPRRPHSAQCLGLLALALVALAGTGCGPTAQSRLWADTALPDGGFSLQRHQWAYDGETVTFELECDPGMANYTDNNAKALYPADFVAPARPE